MVKPKGQPHALTGGQLEVHFSKNRIFSARNAKLFPGQLCVGEDFGKATERPMATMWIIDQVREQALFLAYRIRAVDCREHSSARLAAGGNNQPYRLKSVGVEPKLSRLQQGRPLMSPS